MPKVIRNKKKSKNHEKKSKHKGKADISKRRSSSLRVYK